MIYKRCIFLRVNIKTTCFGHIGNHQVLCQLRFHYGPVQNEDGLWRIRMNYELNDLIINADIVRFVKKQKNGLAGSRNADGRKKNT